MIVPKVRLLVAKGPVDKQRMRLAGRWDVAHARGGEPTRRIAHCTSIMSRKPEIMLDIHPPRLSLWDPSAVHSRIQLAAVWITAYDYMHNS